MQCCICFILMYVLLFCSMQGLSPCMTQRRLAAKLVWFSTNKRSLWGRRTMTWLSTSLAGFHILLGGCSFPGMVMQLKRIPSMFPHALQTTGEDSFIKNANQQLQFHFWNHEHVLHFFKHNPDIGLHIQNPILVPFWPGGRRSRRLRLGRVQWLLRITWLWFLSVALKQRLRESVLDIFVWSGEHSIGATVSQRSSFDVSHWNNLYFQQH